MRTLRAVWRGSLSLLLLSLVLAVLLLAVYASLGRLLMPRLAAQQPAIEQWLAEQLPFPLHFDTLQGGWLRLSPSLVLTGVQAEVPVRGTQWQFSAQRVAVEIDVLRSLYYRQLQLGDVSLQGAALHMQGQPLDLFRGDSTAQTTALQPAAVMVWVMNLGFVGIQDARLLLDIPGLEQPLRLSLDLALERQGDFRRLRLGMGFGEAADGSRLQAVAEARQSATGGLAGMRAYADLEAFALNQWLQGVAWSGTVPQLAEAVSARLWAHWVPGGEVRLRGQLHSPRLVWGAEAAPALEDFSSEFLLARDRRQQWRLDVPNIDFVTAGVASPLSGLQLAYRPGQPWRLGLAALDLPQTQAWLQASGLLPPALAQVLDTLAPQGRLRPAVLSLTREQAQWQWRLQAQADGLAVSPWHGAPGLTGVSGYLQADARGGFIDLDSRDFSMHFPPVYEAPMQFSGARARVGWQIEPGRVTVSSSRIDLDSAAHGPAHGLLALNLPLVESATDVPWMSLVVSLQDAPAAVRAAYIPAILAPDLRRWLADSIGDGRVSRGGFIFDGPLVGRADRSAVIQLHLDIESAALDYHPQWPPLSAVDARLLLDDQAVTVWARRGRVLDSRLGATRVDVRDDANGALSLFVDGQLQGPAADVLRLLRESPLSEALGGAFDDWQASGEYGGRLALSVPLAGSAEPQVQIDARLHGVHLRLDALGLAFDRVQGPLQYDSRTGLQSSALAAQLWQQPLTVAIHSRRDAAGYHTDLQARGAVAVSALTDWLDWPWLHFVEGQAAVEGRLQVLPGQAPWLELVSDLQGVTVALPAPYAKAADTAWPFTAVIPLAADALMDFRIGSGLRVGVLRQAEAPARTVVAFGQTGLPLPRQPGITLQGRLAEFDWDLWQAPVERLLADFGGTGAPGGGDAGAAFRIAGVYVDTLQVFGQSFRQVMVDARHEQRWWLGVRSQDLMGQLGFPLQAGEPYLARLDRLRLPEGVLGRPAADPAFALADLDWSDWPAVQLELGRLEVGALDLGRWRFQVQPAAERLAIERLRVESSLLRIDAEDGGAWLHWQRPAVGTETTALHGNLLLRDVARVFQTLGIDPGISAQEGVLGLHLNWPGHPLAASRERIAGQVGLRFSNGVIRTDRKAEEGLLKALGFFNLDRILRRIQLDFSDLAADGLAFDTARSKVSFADGWLTLDEPVEIRSASSHFFLEGRMDLVNDQLDNRLIVTLPVSSSLPWLAALAGGLPAAAGVYIVSKLVDVQVDRFTSLEYAVSGSSREPQVRFRKLFDVGALWPAWAGGREATPKPAVPDGAERQP